MAAYPTPEQAALSEDSVPAEYARVVAVEHAPDGMLAVVFVAYNEAPAVEPYVVLCQRADAGWVQRQGGSGVGVSWKSTSDDGSDGALVTWDPPSVRWGVPAGEEPSPQASDDPW